MENSNKLLECPRCEKKAKFERFKKRGFYYPSRNSKKIQRYQCPNCSSRFILPHCKNPDCLSSNIRIEEKKRKQKFYFICNDCGRVKAKYKCPKCNSKKTHPNATTEKGVQYLCRSCDNLFYKSFSNPLTSPKENTILKTVN